MLDQLDQAVAQASACINLIHDLSMSIREAIEREQDKSNVVTLFPEKPVVVPHV